MRASPPTTASRRGKSSATKESSSNRRSSSSRRQRKEQQPQEAAEPFGLESTVDLISQEEEEEMIFCAKGGDLDDSDGDTGRQSRRSHAKHQRHQPMDRKDSSAGSVRKVFVVDSSNTALLRRSLEDGGRGLSLGVLPSHSGVEPSSGTPRSARHSYKRRPPASPGKSSKDIEEEGDDFKG
jgi:hypothetical protein